MNLAEVVIREVQRDVVSMHLDLLAESVRESGEAAHMHPHREVLSLDVARRDVLPVRAASDRRSLNAGDLAGVCGALRLR